MISVDVRRTRTQGRVNVTATTDWGEERPIMSDSAKLRENLNLAAHTGLLPPVVRWVSRYGHGVILERPPQMVTLHYYGVKRGSIYNASKEQLYEIALPWTIYGIVFDAKFRPAMLRLYARPEPVNSFDDHLQCLPLPNLYNSGEFCLPQQAEWMADESVWTMGQGIIAAYNQVWATGYNTDITEMIVRAFTSRQPAPLFEGKDPGEPIKASNLFARWEKASQANPNAVVNWTWLPHEGSVRSLAEHLARTEDQSYGLQMIQAQLRSGGV